MAGDRVVDKLFLPQPHAALWPALAGEARRRRGRRIAGHRRDHDRRGDGAAPPTRPRRRPRCASPRCSSARGIGGKAFFTVTGPLGEVEAAVEAAVGVLDAALVHTTEIIPAPHADLVAKLR